MPDVLAEALIVIGGQLAGDFAEAMVRKLEDVDIAAGDTTKALGKIQDIADKAGAAASKGLGVVSDVTGRAGDSVGALSTNIVSTSDNLAAFGIISQDSADKVATGFDAVETTLTSVSAATDLASQAATIYTSGLTKLPAVQKAVALGQRAINLAMRANPIGLIITAITLLAAGLVLAYKKSETFRKIVNAAFNGVKAVATTVFNFIKTAASGAFNFVIAAGRGLKNFLGTIWDGVAGAARIAFNGLKAVLRPIAGIINTIIRGVNKVSGAVGVPPIPEIPKFASGVRNFRGGFATVGEGGAETVYLPPGSDVYSNAESKRMAAGMTQNNTYIFTAPESFTRARQGADWSAKWGSRFGASTRAVTA